MKEFHQSHHFNKPFDQAFEKENFRFNTFGSWGTFLILHYQMSRSTSATLIVPCSYHSLLFTLPDCLLYLLLPSPSTNMGHTYPGKLCCPCSTAFLRARWTANSCGINIVRGIFILTTKKYSSKARNSISKFQVGAASHTQKFILESNTSNRWRGILPQFTREIPPSSFPETDKCA